MGRWRFRNVTPHGLYGRSVAMTMIPVLGLLALTAWFYYAAHIREVNRSLSDGIARQALAAARLCEAGPEAVAASLEGAELTLDCNIGDLAWPEGASASYAYQNTLEAQMSVRLAAPVSSTLLTEDSVLDIRFPGPGDQTRRLLVERKRALLSNAHFLMVWIIIVAALLLAIGIAFLRQQVRSILTLSDAAKALGRGERAESFSPSGATEVREAAKALLQMRARLTAFADQRTAMLAGVSHDLRTPLTRLKLQLALLDGDEADKAAARQDIDDMQAMLDEYLAFASQDIQAGPPERFDLVAMLQRMMERRDGAVLRSVPDRLKMTGRALAIERAVANLLDNAAKHAAAVEISLSAGPHHAEIIVDDDGPGIPEERRADALAPFSRLDTARSQNLPGSGLGLTLALDTARAHGGDLRLETSPLGGLRARLRLAL